MKTLTIKTPKTELLVVELPIGWDYEPITDDKTFIYHKTEEGTNDHHIEGYTLLGKPDEISEEDARELVERIGEGDPCYQGDWFVNYQDDEYMCETAKESLLSLLESEIYWENPLGEEPQDISDLGEFTVMMRKRHQEWQEAERKTFSRNRALIFIKNK